VVDPRFKPGPFQGSVGGVRPFLAPGFQQFLSVPVAVFWAETFRGDVSSGEKNVGVRVFSVLIVERHVCDHAAIHELLFHEGPDQLFPVTFLQLLGKRDFHLAGDLGIFALFSAFHFVP